jgi:PKHD-type hydroxylase
LLQNVLTPDQVAAIVAGLERDGGTDAAGDAAGDVIGPTLLSHEPFANAILPTALTPFRFERHEPGTPIPDRMENPLVGLGTAQSMRIDAVCMVFLSDPASYDGGELIIDATTTPTPVKLSAGNAVVFPAGDFQAVSPVTSGRGWVAGCGIQSAVRGTREREILTEMWVVMNDFKALQSPDGSGGPGGNDGHIILGKARSNLIRLLAEG